MRGGIMYKQRDIVLMPFPYSDLTNAKKRPALIISNEKLNNTEDVICSLITSNPPDNGILIEAKDFSSGKLPFKSWVKPQRIFTINQGIIIKKICSVDDKFHKKVINEINALLK
jgi:mRNA interferase MazF